MAKWALAIMLMLPAGAPLARPDISLEYAVKATYLYKLAPFVNWPSGTFKSPDAPFDICVLGRNPFDHFLETAVVGRKLGTHPFEVRRPSAMTSDAGCQIVFIGAMHAEKERAVLQALRGKPVLTVTDSSDPGSHGSVMQFVVEHGRVRFEIDNAAAIRNHLAVSSKLLDLALAVKGAG